MERARPEAKISVMAFQVLRRHCTGSYSVVLVLQYGSVDVVVLDVTLPCGLDCHGQCTSSASTYVMPMSDRIWLNSACVSL